MNQLSAYLRILVEGEAAEVAGTPIHSSIRTHKFDFSATTESPSEQQLLGSMATEGTSQESNDNFHLHPWFSEGNIFSRVASWHRSPPLPFSHFWLRIERVSCFVQFIFVIFCSFANLRKNSIYYVGVIITT